MPLVIFIFFSTQDYIKGNHYNSDDEVKANIKPWITEKSKNFSVMQSKNIEGNVFGAWELYFNVIFVHVQQACV